MAFLDNSGDIVLDAVLTETGRRKLARGAPLDIRAFGLGDDEINYSTYNLNHASGSAYEDLELLQTPILESITGRPAAINHGLLKNTSNYDLLYMPVLKINEIEAVGVTTEPSAPPAPITKNMGSVDGVFYILATAATFDAISTANTAGELATVALPAGTDPIARAFHPGYAPETGIQTIVIENGLDSTDLPKDLPTLEIYGVSEGLMSSKFAIDLDRRLFKTTVNAKVEAVYNSDTGLFSFGGSPTTKPLTGGGSMGPTEVYNYTRTIMDSSTVRLFVASDASVTPPVSNYSAIAGPSFRWLSFVPGLNQARLCGGSIDSLWTDMGKLRTGAQLLTGATGTFASTNFYQIDTTVYVQNADLGQSTQFIIRIIRKA